MPKYNLEKLNPVPEFDMVFYMEIAGETRLDQDMLEEFEPRWDEWVKMLHAYKLTNTEGEGTFLLLYLEESVEDQIEGIWQDSPSFGMLFHNLAITMVMSAAQGFLPELADGRCAPLPQPGQGVLDAFESLGLTWNEEGTVNRKFAVFTLYPYSAGCEVCMLSEKCPKSTVARG